MQVNDSAFFAIIHIYRRFRRLRDQVDELSSRYNQPPAQGTIARGTTT